MAYARKFLSDTHPNSIPPPSSPEADSVEVESDFVIILAALLCALICVVGLIAVARCAWLRRGLTSVGSGAGNRLANKGLNKKVLNSLPKYTFSSDSNKVVADCAICLSEYVDGDQVRVLPHCGHRFHLLCIDTWLGSHSSCPSCRQILVVARCRKCGEYPTVGSAVVGGGDGCRNTIPKPSQVSSSAGAPSTSSPTFLP